MIKFETLVPEISSRDLQVQEQKSFYKIARDGKAVYISKTKRAITRVDVSGFELDHPAITPPAKPNGKVTGQVDMSHENALDAILNALDGLVNGEKGSKRVPGEKAPKAPKAETVKWDPEEFARLAADELERQRNA